MGQGMGHITGYTAPEVHVVERPTACVIGAGLSGISVAKELADRGFDVTVYDRNKKVGRGSTVFDSGVVGAPFTPTGYDAEWMKDLILGFLPFNLRPLLAHEMPLYNVPTGMDKLRFYYSRAKMLWWQSVTRDHVVEAGNWLALENEQVILQQLEELPELEEAVYPGTTFRMLQPGHWKSLNLKRNQNAGNGNEPQIADQLVIDPCRWCEIMARHLKEKKDVKFRMEYHVTDIQAKFDWNVEFVNKAKFVTKDPKTGEQTKVHSKSYDIYVACTGARTHDITASDHGYPVPILQTTTYGMLFNSAHPQWGQLVPGHPRAVYAQLMDSGAIKSHRASISLSQALPDTGGLLSSEGDAPWWVVSGLTSLNTGTFSREDPRNSRSYVSQLFADRLGVFKGIALPKVENNDPSVQVFRYQKDMTPDGLPVVSRIANYRNFFVCAGMGNDVSRFSAGSAALLGRIIDHKALDDLSNPFSSKRFGEVVDTDELLKDPAEYNKRSTFEMWLASVGQPLETGLLNWWRDSQVIRNINPNWQKFGGAWFGDHEEGSPIQAQTGFWRGRKDEEVY